MQLPSLNTFGFCCSVVAKVHELKWELKEMIIKQYIFTLFSQAQVMKAGVGSPRGSKTL